MHTEYLIFYRREISLLRKKGAKWGKKKLGLLLLFSTLNQKKNLSKQTPKYLEKLLSY